MGFRGRVRVRARSEHQGARPFARHTMTRTIWTVIDPEAAVLTVIAEDAIEAR